MVLGFVLVLCVVGVLLSLAMYANLLPFIWLLWDIKEYNMAYYGAQSSIERSLLVLRYQDPGFQWHWGYIESTFTWAISDHAYFWIFTKDDKLYWEINGRWSTVPLSWQGTIDLALLSGVSNDYNTIHYWWYDRIPLWYDSTLSENAYNKDTNYVFLSWIDNINLKVRVNPFVENIFNSWDISLFPLCDSNCDSDNDWLSDDIALDRSWKWSYNDDNWTWFFHILPRYKTLNNNWLVTVLSGDESIRESVVNDMATDNDLSLSFWWDNNNFNPIADIWNLNREDNLSHLIITDNDELSGMSFNKLLSTNSIANFQEINLWLVNLLQSENLSVYPNIEYKISCDDCDNNLQLSQPYFTINGEGRVWNYDIKMKLYKWISDDSAISLFTVVF